MLLVWSKFASSRIFLCLTMIVTVYAGYFAAVLFIVTFLRLTEWSVSLLLVGCLTSSSTIRMWKHQKQVINVAHKAHFAFAQSSETLRLRHLFADLAEGHFFKLRAPYSLDMSTNPFFVPGSGSSIPRQKQEG